MDAKAALTARAVPSEHVTLDPRLDLDGNWIDVEGEADAGTKNKR